MDVEVVNTARVLRVNKNDYLLDDNTSLVKTKDIPSLRIGDKVEISTDGKTVFWNFIVVSRAGNLPVLDEGYYGV